MKEDISTKGTEAHARTHIFFVFFGGETGLGRFYECRTVPFGCGVANTRRHLNQGRARAKKQNPTREDGVRQ
jgi:hypothetical protein